MPIASIVLVHTGMIGVLSVGAFDSALSTCLLLVDTLFGTVLIGTVLIGTILIAPGSPRLVPTPRVRRPHAEPFGL